MSIPLGRIAAAVIGLMAALAAIPALARDVYLSPGGDEQANGLTAANAAATLQQAMQIAQALPSDEGAVRILVSPGTYRGQALKLSGKNLTQKITIVGTSEDRENYPRFIGDGGANTWLTLSSSEGRPTGLTIRRLHVSGYLTAISLNGNRNKKSAYNWGTRIEDNVFSAIGSIATKGGSPSTAAIRLVNSRDNVIKGNQFLAIKNKKKCHLIHSVYLAHFSSGNRIEGNEFRDLCGSAVRLRDRSNGNIIAGNVFTDLHKAPAIDEWFCDKGARDDCTKPAGECPSTGNVEKENRFPNIKESRQVLIKGNRKPRCWCAAADFSDRRVVRHSSEP